MSDDVPEPPNRNAHDGSPTQRGRTVTPIVPVIVLLLVLGLVHQLVGRPFIARGGGPAINTLLTELLPFLLVVSVVVTSACAVGCYARGTLGNHD
jgi:hypothetical protein